MDDLISRRATIDALDKLHYNDREDWCFVLDTVEFLPSAQPKKGKWYKLSGMMPPEYTGVYRCSECNEWAMRDWKRHTQMLSNFCPNCGADMTGVSK